MKNLQNIRVIAQYYTKITMTRFTELLDLPPITAERTLCKLVTDKTIYARIDRPAGIVSFKPKKNIDETLNGWSGDVSKMLSLVEKTSHLVSKVRTMLHTILSGGADDGAGVCDARSGEGQEDQREVRS